MDMNVATSHQQSLAKASIRKELRTSSTNSLELDETLFDGGAVAAIKSDPPDVADAEEEDEDDDKVQQQDGPVENLKKPTSDAKGTNAEQEDQEQQEQQNSQSPDNEGENKVGVDEDRPLGEDEDGLPTD